MALDEYRGKRDFQKTTEPDGGEAAQGQLRFVIHEHHATRLHFDVRLEMDGVLKSWAVPKGPSLNPADRRLAVEVEDHPLKYLDFAGNIPEGNYGAGDIAIWDSGTYRLFEGEDPVTEWEHGRLKIEIFGQRLRGKFALIRMKDEKNWLLIKDRDEYADRNWSLEKIYDWNSNRSKPGNALAKAAIPSQRAVDIPGARRASMPERVSPMLATAVDVPFDDDDWLFELKWDGYRGICFIRGDAARLVSRNDIDLGPRCPFLADIPKKLRAEEAILDGELVALDDKGVAQFQLMQTALQRGSQGAIAYYVFDILYCDGIDLTDCKLTDRKQLLKDLLIADGDVRYSDHVVGSGKALYNMARKSGVEGLMAKLSASCYEPRRSRDWLKMKILKHAEVVIGGYTEPRGSRQWVGSLLAGVYEGDNLIPVGHVSIGSSDRNIQRIYEKLNAIETKESPFSEPARTNETPHWVKPELVAQVKFGDWTHDRQLRHSIFLGFREDKSPRDCVFETVERAEQTVKEVEREVQAAAKSSPKSGTKQKYTDVDAVLSDKSIGPDAAVDVDGVVISLTNLDKVYWPDDGYTKRDLLRYYWRVSSTILPHLRDRPLILKRYVNGINAPAFFQHDLKDAPAFVHIHPVEEDGKTVRYAVCNQRATLLYLANLGSISFDPWLATIPHNDGDPPRPDMIVFDLDPLDSDLSAACEVALAIRDELDKLGLACCAKTSGASGIHVYLPIKAVYDFSVALDFANVVAYAVSRAKPKLVTLERRIKNRGDSPVYLDCYQNSPGKSVSGPYSARARKGATVSTPVSWDEIAKTVRIEDFTIENLPDRLEQVGDLFVPILTEKQHLSKALEVMRKSLRD